METCHLPIGTLLQGGKYKIVRFISSGGFGCTYEAEHTLLEMRVAIKEFFVQTFCNRDETTAHVTVGTLSNKGLVNKLRGKFIDEAKAIFNMKHPNIVRVSDVFEENSTAYYVMDYIDGQSLGALLKQEGTLPEKKVLKYTHQVADALRYVHERNRLHLDVKPSNIMIDNMDNAILIDFGASKQYDEENGQNTTTIMGKTPGYAPLEQMGNDVVKFYPATDIYALGATMYKMLTGNTPPEANLLANGDKELGELPESIGKSTSTAILTAMKIRRQDRPQSMAAFLSILDGDGTEEDLTIIDANRNKPVETIEPQKPKVSQTKKSKEKQRKRNESMVKMVSIVAICVLAIVVVIGVWVTNLGGTDAKEKADNDVTALVKEKRRALYDAIKDEYNVGTWEEFDSKMDDPSKRKALYNAIKDTYDVGTWDEFEGKVAGSVSGNELTKNLLSDIGALPNGQKPLNGMINGHEYMDLGLSVKWATCNVGAGSPEDYGNYYAWGETRTKTTYTEDNSVIWKKDMGDIAGDPTYDAACANWGSPWRLPTYEEILELARNCTMEWTICNGVRGMLFTSDKNGNSIFLPAAGDCFEESLCRDVGEWGGYWTSLPFEGNAPCAYSFKIDKDGFYHGWGVSPRYEGRSVRAVSE